MRKLLVIATLVVVSGLSALMQEQPTEASGIGVYAYLYHPTGTLACGWHYNCDGDGSDTNKLGLDWVSCDDALGCPSSTWYRLKLYASVHEWVARGTGYNSSILGCPYGITLAIQRISDYALFGYIIELHSQATSTTYRNFYAGSGGVQNSGGLGSFVNYVNDPCSGFWHTMQWYASGWADIDGAISKNTNIPNESSCHNWSDPPCRIGYDIWTTYEYMFAFIS